MPHFVIKEHDEITLSSLNLHFPCAAVYEDIDFTEGAVGEESDREQ